MRWSVQFSSGQSLSHVWLFVTPWTAAHQASRSITISRVYSNSCPLSQWCHPTISSSVIPFSHRQSSPASECFPMSLIRWPKYWSFSFSISPSNEYSGLISFRIDWLDCLGVQGALKSLLQHHSSKASILWHSAFFMVQLSYPYMFSSVQSLSCVRSFVTHEPQHARPPCPSPTPGVYPDSCPLSRWYHPTILSSVIPFSSCPQSFPISGSFQMSQFFTSGGQSIGVSASTSVLPMNTQDWSALG